MGKFLLGVYVGASAVFMWGMFIELNHMRTVCASWKIEVDE